MVDYKQTAPAKTTTTPPLEVSPATMGLWNSGDDPIFLALLAGEVANRGISWYANTTLSTVASRVALLKRTAQVIRNALVVDTAVM